MDYDDFNIRLESKGDDTFKVSVESPAGHDTANIRIEHGVEQILSMLRSLGATVRGYSQGEAGLETATVTRKIEFIDKVVTQPSELGKTLYRDLFAGAVDSKFNQSLGNVKGRQRGLRIKLHIDPEDPEIARMASLPWELLCHPDMGDQPLALSVETPLVRYLSSPRPLNLRDFTLPLRILVVVSDPAGVAQLDLEKERASIAATWGDHEHVEVTFLERATVQALSNELARREYHILHYMGHGDFDVEQGVGVLLMETADGQADAVDGRTLGVLLQDAQSLRLVFVNACNTAQATQSAGRDPYAGISTALVMAGVPAVIAMQFPISDKAAIAFTDCLYPRLAQGFPLDSAVGEARKAIRIVDRSSLEWATPVLFMRTPDGRLFDLAGATPDSPTSDGAIGLQSQTGRKQALPQRRADTPPAATAKRKSRFGPAVALLLSAAAAALAIGYIRSIPPASLVPSAAEHERFVAAADADTVSAADIEAMSAPALRDVLEMKALAGDSDRIVPEVNARIQQLTDALSDASSGAAVTLYLASQIDSLRSYFNEKTLAGGGYAPALRRASDGGDALASFWLAMAMRGELTERPDDASIDPDDPQFTAYCDMLGLAADQGMAEVAESWAAEDTCP